MIENGWSKHSERPQFLFVICDNRSECLPLHGGSRFVVYIQNNGLRVTGKITARLDFDLRHGLQAGPLPLLTFGIRSNEGEQTHWWQKMFAHLSSSDFLFTEREWRAWVCHRMISHHKWQLGSVVIHRGESLGWRATERGEGTWGLFKDVSPPIVAISVLMRQEGKFLCPDGMTKLPVRPGTKWTCQRVAHQQQRKHTGGQVPRERRRRTSRPVHNQRDMRATNDQINEQQRDLGTTPLEA